MFSTTVRRRALATLAAAAVSIPASAQTGASVSFGRALTGIAAADPVETRQATSASVMAEHRASNEAVRLYYTLDAASFTTPGDWAYYLHTAGVSWHTVRKQGSTRPVLFAGAAASWRANGDSWSAANYRAVNLFANVEWKPRATRALRAGYRLDVRGFPDSAALNQTEHTLFGSALLNFRSRTTVITEARAGYKAYSGSPRETAIAAPVTVATAEAGAAHGMGQGRGMGPSLRVNQAVWTATHGGGSTAASRHVTLLGRLAQSVTDRSGMSVQYTRRLTAGGLPSVLVTTPALYFDDGVYDDPFASDAGTWLASLKHVTGGGAEIEATGSWSRKDYRSALAFDAEGTETAARRADRIERAGLGISKPLFPSRTGRVGLSLDVDYWFTRHRSNDAFYNYTSHLIGAQIAVSY